MPNKPLAIRVMIVLVSVDTDRHKNKKTKKQVHNHEAFFTLSLIDQCINLLLVKIIPI